MVYDVMLCKWCIVYGELGMFYRKWGVIYGEKESGIMYHKIEYYLISWRVYVKFGLTYFKSGVDHVQDVGR